MSKQFTKDEKKLDYNKMMFQLLDPDWEFAIAAVMTFALIKGYKTDSWKDVDNFIERYFGAEARHRCERRRAQKDKIGASYYDAESGLPHSWHQFTTLAFEITKEIEDLGLDLSKITVDSIREHWNYYKNKDSEITEIEDRVTAKDFIDTKTKVTSEQSKKIQEIVFDLGITWRNTARTIKYTGDAFLYFSKNFHITSDLTNDSGYFLQHDYREINAQEIIDRYEKYNK